MPHAGIIAFSLMMEEMADGSINYSVEKPLLLRGLYTCFHMDSESSAKTDCLVHFGGLELLPFANRHKRLY